MYFARLARSLRKDKLIRQGYGLETLWLTVHILTTYRSLGLQQSSFEDKLLVTVQKNLHLFNFVPGEHEEKERKTHVSHHARC
jgi:hypothetical protein